jgi:hypothetical protein
MPNANECTLHIAPFRQLLSGLQAQRKYLHGTKIKIFSHAYAFVMNFDSFAKVKFE